MENTPPRGAARLLQRRVKRACEACRLRKRKCDGALPCKLCVQNNYTCYFELRAPRSHAHPTTVSSTDQSPPEMEPEPTKSPIERHAGQITTLTPAEAMSSETFSRALGTKLAPTHAPKSHIFAFNVGLNTSPVVRCSAQATRKFVSYEAMVRYCNVYFDCVHSIFGFLNRQNLESLCKVHWQTDSEEVIPSVDAILCGVACIGCIFDNYDDANIAEALAENAKLALATNADVEPSIEIIAGWLLRILYLRFTKSPYSGWICSATAMHLAEATGLHKDAQSTSMSNPDIAGEDIQLRRRLFWFTRQLHTWISLEYGRSWVDLRNTTCKKPASTPANPSSDLMTFFDISECLLTCGTGDAEEFENAIVKLYGMNFAHDASQLSRSMLVLSIYRRLWLMNPHRACAVSRYIISICKEGLEAVDRLVQAGSPWWHLAALPLGFLCVLLVMDTKESLAEVSNVVDVLHRVQQRFDTISTRGAANYANHLIRFLRERKQNDTKALDIALQTTSTTMKDQVQGLPSEHGTPMVGETNDSGQVFPGWEQNYNFDGLDWKDINWDLFLNQPNLNFEAACWS